MRKLAAGTETGRTIVVLKKDLDNGRLNARINEMLLSTPSTLLTELRNIEKDDVDLLPECRLGVFARSIETVSRFLADFIVSSEPERVVRVPEPSASGGDDPTDLYTHLRAIGAIDNARTGEGVEVVILDTGVVEHPDFRAQLGLMKTFVGSDAVDRNGHGTHCAGLIVGPRTGARAYGVAPNAKLHVGKVLNDNGLGVDWTILRGFCWASHLPARVIVMCIASPVGATGPSAAYESVAQRVAARNGVVIAAAGNKIPNTAERVNHPANCPTIFAVGAMTRKLNPADFSCVKEPPDGDGVEFTEPGVGIRSAWYDMTHKRQNGTSMSAAICAGVAALWVEYLPETDNLAKRLVLEQKVVLRCP